MMLARIREILVIRHRMSLERPLQAIGMHMGRFKRRTDDGARREAGKNPSMALISAAAHRNFSTMLALTPLGSPQPKHLIEKREFPMKNMPVSANAWVSW